MSDIKEDTIETMEHFIRTLKHILDTGTQQEKARVVRWMAKYVAGGK